MTRPDVGPEGPHVAADLGGARGSSPAARAGRVTADQIVATAARLFASDGYHEVGMREIADALGIRGASLYHHYSSKEEILYAICLTVSREPVEQQLTLLDENGTPTTRLAALVRAHLMHLVQRQVEHLVGRHEMNALSPEHRAVIDDHRRYYHRRVADTIAAGVRAGEFEVSDVRLATFALLDMLNGTSAWYHHTGAKAADEIADAYVDLAIGSLLRGRTP
ncbi:TetR/AcrR family transcriptional regulator [Nakamurella sp. PAMC28650]|uniref:TetR/AcrR family transcriptional regulator n=1 Tax=Nakamurella sp. PAMC28650 TaxID=2762325 RepID=UPI001C9ABAB8|nr:TetR/AcrR family transcriptional regulator [Nakamurella sp. PAMC28650]